MKQDSVRLSIKESLLSTNGGDDRMVQVFLKQYRLLIRDIRLLYRVWTSQED